MDFSPRMLALAARLTEATGAPGDVDPVRRPGDAARPRWDRRPRLHRSRFAHLAAGPRRLGRGRRAAAVPGPGGSCCSRATRPSGCSMPTRTAAGSPRTTTTSAAPRRRRAGRPNTSTTCPSDDGDQSWKFARAWTLGEIVTALLRAGLRLEAVDRVPDRLVGRPRRRPGGGPRPRAAVVLDHGSARPRNRPSAARLTGVTPTIAARSIGP